VPGARRAESLGSEHLLAYDHVLGVDPDRPGWDGSYDDEDQFHEPLTLFSHLAGVTTDLSFVTGVLALPRRQTPLVAKQAAQVDRFSDGQFRLGIGVGWNDADYVSVPHLYRGFDPEAHLESLETTAERLADAGYRLVVAGNAVGVRSPSPRRLLRPRRWGSPHRRLRRAGPRGRRPARGPLPRS